MSDDLASRLPDLSPEERGLLLGLGLVGGDDRMTERLDPAARERCAGLLGELRALSREERAALLAELLAEMTSCAPAGAERLHPSWLADAVAGEPAELALALLAGLRGPTAEAARSLVGGDFASAARVEAACPPEVLGELRRCAFVRLEPLCASRGGPLAEQLAALDESELDRTVLRWGAWAIGRSLHGAEPAVRARAMAAVGEPWAAEIAAASVRPLCPADRASALVHASAPLPPGARTPEERLRAVGLACLRDALADEGHASVVRVAGRLPAALGRTWLGW